MRLHRVANLSLENSLKSQDTDPITGYPLGQILATAIHEAGHALQCLLEEVTIEEAVIDPKQAECLENGVGVLGFVRHREITDPCRRIRVSVAGFVGEYLASGKPNNPGASCDRENVKDAMRDLGEPPLVAKHSERALVAETQWSLYNHLPTLFVVADALLEKRRLEPADFDSLFKRGRDYEVLNEDHLSWALFPRDNALHLAFRLELGQWSSPTHLVEDYGDASTQWWLSS